MQNVSEGQGHLRITGGDEGQHCSPLFLSKHCQSCACMTNVHINGRLGPALFRYLLRHEQHGGEMTDGSSKS